LAGCSGSGAETGSTGPSGGKSTPGSDPTPTATVGATTETPNSLETVEVDDNWRDFQSDPAHTGTTDNAGPVTEGRLRWRYETAASALLDGSPALLSGTVYGGTGDGVLSALDASEGTVRWQTRLGSRAASPVIDGGKLYLTTVRGDTAGRVHAVDASVGTELWSVDIPARAQYQPTVADGSLYIGTYVAGMVHSVNARSGEREWSADVGDGDRNYVHASPSVADGTVVVPAGGTDLHAIDADTGDRSWMYSIDERIYSSPAIVDGTVYAGTSAGTVFAVDADDGSEQWLFRPDRDAVSFSDSPSVSAGTVYVGSRTSGVFAIDATDGTRKWHSPGGSVGDRGDTVLGPEGLYAFGGSTGYALDPSTGEVRWQFQFDAEKTSSPAIASGLLFVTVPGVGICAFEEG
jgi:outer membrane protein assembly factor BamB